MPPINGRYPGIPTTSPWVSVLVPVHNSEHAIRATILSLLRQNYQALWEIIVIGSSDDRTWRGFAGVDDPRLLLLERSTPLGIPDRDFKVRVGLAVAATDVVVLIEPGVVLPPDWMRRQVADLLDSGEAQSSSDLAMGDDRTILLVRADYLRLLRGHAFADLSDQALPPANSQGRKRFAAFSFIGALVFIAGSGLQAGLMRIHLSSDWSYGFQTVFSIELSYVLNRVFTWVDREVSIVRSLLLWNIQRSALAAPNVLLYDWLAGIASNWMFANILATGAFTIVNYLVANFWSFGIRSGSVGRTWLRIT